jgi:hypothetical protein
VNILPVIAMTMALHTGGITVSTPGNLPLCPKVALAPGDSVTLPGYYVTDTGNTPYEIKWDVNPSVADNWIITPSVRLTPKETVNAVLRLTIPSGAQSGQYFAQLTASPGNAPGKSIDIDFGVHASPPAQCQGDVSAAPSGGGPSAKTIGLIAGLPVLVGGALWVRRRFSKGTKADA